MKYYPSIMVDLETLSVAPDAQVLSLSAVAFDELDPDPQYDQYPVLDMLVSLDGQEHRREDPATVEWWSQRDPEVIAKIFAEDGRVPLKDALQQFSTMCWQKKRIWCQGMSLDHLVLEHAMKELGMGLPWNYWQWRDSRTIMDIVEVELPDATHDSLEDTFRQVIGLQIGLQKLGVTKFNR